MSAHYSHSHGARHATMNPFEPPLPDGHARDPVCSMSVDPATAKHQAEHAGTTY
jgi:Cu+-exporting ATPase